MNQPVTLLKSHFSLQGGLEKATHFLIDSLRKKGHSIKLITSATDLPQIEGVEAVQSPHKPKMSLQKLWLFDRFCQDYLKQNPSPIVFGLDRNSFQTHLRAGNGVHRAFLEKRKEVESVFHALRHPLNPLHQMLLSIEKKGFEHPQLRTLFTNSEMVKREILHFYNVDPGKIVVIHNGVEWKLFEPAFNAWEQKRDLLLEQKGLDPHAYQFLFLGHHYKRKGLIPLLRALGRLKNESFQLSVVGREKECAFFQHLAEKEGIGERVFFFGEQRDTIPFYQMADCLVIPSHYDPFANVTVEALAMGLFVVSSKANGGREVLNDKNGCVIEDLADSESFATSLQKALKRPKNLEQSAEIRKGVASLEIDAQLSKYLNYL